MHQVRCRVVSSRSVSLLDVNFCRHYIADFQTAFLNLYFVDDQALRWRIGVANYPDKRSLISFYPFWQGELSRQAPGITHLSARFCVEWSLIQYDFAFIPFNQELSFLLTLNYGEDLRFFDRRQLVSPECCC